MHISGAYPRPPAQFLRDDSDGLSCIPLPVSHKHRHYRHHRHLKQASRFNLRLACFILSNAADFYVVEIGDGPVKLA